MEESQPYVHQGVLPPGTRLTVASHKVVIDRFLSEGGFAHVYAVTLKQPVQGIGQTSVLKRVLAMDKNALVSIRTEVETMV